MGKDPHIYEDKTIRKERHPIGVGGAGFIYSTFEFEDKDLIKKHLITLDSLLNKEPNFYHNLNNDEIKALEYFNFDVRYTMSIRYFETDRHLRGYDPDTRFKCNELENIRNNKDFFDLLRDLRETLKNISKEIRDKNDRSSISPEIKSTRAYIEAFLDFVDAEDGLSPDEMPSALPGGLISKMKKIDLSSVSENMRKWIETSIKILDKMFM